MTISSIRSCDSLARISVGDIDASRSGTRSSQTRMPVPAAAAVSVSAQVRPAPPRSWMPATRPASYSSRQLSISSFSMNGSPTCTDGRRCSASSSKVADASTETPPMPSRPGTRAEQHDDVADAGGFLVLQPLDRQHADAQRVDQRVALVGRVEDDLAADVGQAQAVAVSADAGDHAGQHPGGVGVVGGAEAQRVHHRDRAGAHGEDVADDAADAGGRALVRLDEARVVVRLDLEGHREVVGDLHDARVLPDAGEHPGVRAVPSRRTGAGAPCSTCTSSARST